MTRAKAAIGTIALAIAAPLASQPANPPVVAALAVIPGYTDLAEMVLAAPIVVVADIVRATPLKGDQAAGVPPGRARLYFEADVVTLIRGAGGLPGHVTYLADVPLERSNRIPKLKKQRVLLLAAPVPGRPAELRLVGPAAQLGWTRAAEQRVRAIVAEVIAPDAPPAITGITGAFHVPGSLPGESETQIFLRTAAARPISLSVLRRPGEQARWAVALGEMVDNSAKPPARDTLLWYRLACGLPPRLPDAALATLDEAGRIAAAQDYELIRQGLGPCGRGGAG
ncbi:MAG: hypothetical protein PGN09_00140 [Sphingomonas fennica]